MTDDENVDEDFVGFGVAGAVKVSVLGVCLALLGEVLVFVRVQVRMLV